jgi:hypothetical protein
MKYAAMVLALGLGGCIVHERAPAEAPPGPPVTRDEAERLSAAGVSEPVLVELIEKRGARPLTADDLVALKAAGASDTVVQKMIAAESREPDVVVVREPAYYYYYPYGYSYWGPAWGLSFGYGFYYHSHSHYRPAYGYRSKR